MSSSSDNIKMSEFGDGSHVTLGNSVFASKLQKQKEWLISNNRKQRNSQLSAWQTTNSSNNATASLAPPVTPRVKKPAPMAPSAAPTDSVKQMLASLEELEVPEICTTTDAAAPITAQAHTSGSISTLDEAKSSSSESDAAGICPIDTVDRTIPAIKPKLSKKLAFGDDSHIQTTPQAEETLVEKPEISVHPSKEGTKASTKVSLESESKVNVPKDFRKKRFGRKESASGDSSTSATASLTAQVETPVVVINLAHVSKWKAMWKCGNRTRLVHTPPPPGTTMRCRLVRKRQSLTVSYHVTFERLEAQNRQTLPDADNSGADANKLSLGDQSTDINTPLCVNNSEGEFLMSTESVSVLTKLPNYRIFIDQTQVDLSKKDTTTCPGYLGKLQSLNASPRFILSTPGRTIMHKRQGVPPDALIKMQEISNEYAKLCDLAIHNEDPSAVYPDASTLGFQEKDIIREQLALITYNQGISGMKGPRKITVVLPKIERLCPWAVMTGTSEKPASRDHVFASKEEHSLVQYMRWNDEAKTHILHNRQPVWDPHANSHVINFGGRVRISSVKNFQIQDANSKETVLQFGRVQGNDFVMDLSAPFTPLQAFAVCLTCFKSKE